jgi:hypothetical protein
MKREAILIAAVMVAACAQPELSPSPAPLPTPPAPVSSAATTTALRVEGAVRKWCGSLGGCAYFAELTGPAGPWQAEFVAGEEEALMIDGGLPLTLPAGDYTLTLSSRVVSDAILNGVRQMGPVGATCAADFTVVPGQNSVRAQGLFEGNTCSVTTIG